MLTKRRETKRVIQPRFILLSKSPHESARSPGVRYQIAPPVPIPVPQSYYFWPPFAHQGFVACKILVTIWHSLGRFKACGSTNIWLNVCISRSSEIFTNVPAFHGCIYFIARFPISNCSACLTKSIPVEFLFKYAVFGGRNLATLYHHVNFRNLIKIFRTWTDCLMINLWAGNICFAYNYTVWPVWCFKQSDWFAISGYWTLPTS